MNPFSRKPASLAAALGAVLLAGCAGSTSSGIATDAAPTTTRAPTNSLLMQVRAAGESGNELDVQPLRDPQVEDLRAQATRAEASGNVAAAGSALAKALELGPDQPDLIQWQAELALVARNWAEAERLAAQSYDKGPKLGGLCRRNWTTIRLAAEQRGDAATATRAQQQMAACTVAPPTRM